MPNSRSNLIRDNVHRVLSRVSAACVKAGRSPSEVTLVAVSKRFAADDIGHAYDAGVRHFGENRIQELVEKVAAWQRVRPGAHITWHMVGHLQRNKARDAVAFADIVHGVDSLRLAEALERRAVEAGRRVDCLVQVNVSGEKSKFGLAPESVGAALDALKSFQNLRIRGLMTLARPVDDPEEIRPEFATLREIYEHIRRVGVHPFTILSMGMSGDFEVAIEEGSTHIRVGTAIFGERPD